MRALVFAKRSAREILRDPLNLIFGLAFPVMLILILSLIQKNIPVSIFEIDSLAPGMIVFSFAFITLFSALLISKDRESAFLNRLFATPMKSIDFILGYTLPMLPIALLQAVVCLITGVIFGLKINVNIIYTILASIPMAIFNISFGLMCGSALNSKAVGGLCGALFSNLAAFLSGIWFDVKLIGGVFEKIAKCLPFYNAAEIEKAVYAGNFGDVKTEFIIVCAYAVVSLFIAVLVFLKQMKK